MTEQKDISVELLSKHTNFFKWSTGTFTVGETSLVEHQMQQQIHEVTSTTILLQRTQRWKWYSLCKHSCKYFVAGETVTGSSGATGPVHHLVVFVWKYDSRALTVDDTIIGVQDIFQ